MPLTRITDAVMGGTSVLVTGSRDMAPLLDEATRHMAHTRVVRIRPPFGLPNFISQIAAPGTSQETSPGTDHDETDVERAFRTLTELDTGCERIALLVEGAHDMPHSTLRYIEMAMFTAAHLHVVLAGTPALADTLALEGFTRLHNRVSVHVSLPDAAAPVLARFPAHAALVPTPTAMPPCPRRVPRSGALARLAATGIAASMVLVMLASRSMQAPHGAAVPALSEAGRPARPSRADLPATPAPATVAVPDTAPTPMPATAGVLTEALGAAPVPPVPSAARDEPVVAGLAQAPGATDAAPAPAAPPVLAAMARPASPSRVQPRLVPIRPDRVAVERTPAATQDERRCRLIVQHLQLGEDPTDADRAFLRSGCR